LIRIIVDSEIRDLIAYLRVLIRPEDDISLKRILNVPTRGVGKKSLGILEECAQSKQSSFIQALGEASQLKGLSARVQKSIEGFLKMRAALARKRFEMLPSDLIGEVLERTGLLEELQAENTIEGKSRIENLKEFISVAVDFESNPLSEEVSFEESAESPQRDLLRDFLGSITLETNLDKWSPEEESLTLMSFHMAKGLEFSFVFMVGMEEEIFPHANSMTQHHEDLEEERRLCYVGMTRAMKRLTLTFASSRMLYGFRDSKPPSRFLSEVPSHLIQYIGPGILGAEDVVDDLQFIPDQLVSQADEKEIYFD